MCGAFRIVDAVFVLFLCGVVAGVGGFALHFFQRYELYSFQPYFSPLFLKKNHLPRMTKSPPPSPPAHSCLNPAPALPSPAPVGLHSDRTSRSGVAPPTGTIHPRESRGTEVIKRESKDSFRGVCLSAFGITGGHLAGVDLSGRGFNPRPAQRLERSTHAKAEEQQTENKNQHSFRDNAFPDLESQADI